MDGDVLVAVHLRIQGKGKLTNNTLICLPSSQDLDMGRGWEGPVEHVQEDSMEEERKKERAHHQVWGVDKVPFPPSLGGSIYQVSWGRISSCEEGMRISWLWGRI